MNTLGDRVRILRENRNLTQTQMGDLIGVSRDVINNLERNRNKTLNEPVIKLLALEFEVNEEWLLTGEGSKTPPETSNLAKFIVDLKTGKNDFAAKYIDFLASLTEDEWKIFEKQTAIMKRFYDTLE